MRVGATCRAREAMAARARAVAGSRGGPAAAPSRPPAFLSFLLLPPPFFLESFLSDFLPAARDGCRQYGRAGWGGWGGLVLAMAVFTARLLKTLRACVRGRKGVQAQPHSLCPGRLGRVCKYVHDHRRRHCQTAYAAAGGALTTTTTTMCLRAQAGTWLLLPQKMAHVLVQHAPSGLSPLQDPAPFTHPSSCRLSRHLLLQPHPLPPVQVCSQRGRGGVCALHV